MKNHRLFAASVFTIFVCTSLPAFATYIDVSELPLCDDSESKGIETYKGHSISGSVKIEIGDDGLISSVDSSKITHTAEKLAKQNFCASHYVDGDKLGLKITDSSRMLDDTYNVEVSFSDYGKGSYNEFGGLHSTLEENDLDADDLSVNDLPSFVSLDTECGIDCYDLTGGNHIVDSGEFLVTADISDLSNSAKAELEEVCAEVKVVKKKTRIFGVFSKYKRTWTKFEGCTEGSD